MNTTSHLPTHSARVELGSGAPVSRRTLLGALVAVPAIGALLAACGDDRADGPAAGSSGSGESVAPSTPAGGIAHPLEATAAVIRLGYEGGFVPQGYAFVNTPTLLVSGDGRVFTPGAMTMQYPGPLVGPIAVRTITEDGIQRLLSLANASGLLAAAPDYSIESQVTDVGDTVLRFAAKDGAFEHRAYALDIEDAGPGNETSRANLRAYVTLLTDLPGTVGADALGAESIFEPDAYRFQAYPVDEADGANLDPAPTIVDWPAELSVRLADATECGRLPAAEVGALFAESTQLTWFRDGDQVWSLAVAPVLPGDAAC